MSDVLDNENLETPEGTDVDNQNTSETTPTEEEEIVLIVEDGENVANANSYVTLEEAKLYQTERGRTAWLSMTDNEMKASLIKGTQYVDSLYSWKGRRKYENQFLSFPRVMIIDLDGFEVKGIPTALKKAVMEAAFYGSTSDLFSVRASFGSNLKKDRKKVDGAVEVEQEFEFYNVNEEDVDYISKYAALDSILRGLYIPKNKKSVNAIASWRY